MMPGPQKITFISNSHFFARFELRGTSLWFVWGNPNQKQHNEARIPSTKFRVLRDWLSWVSDVQ